MTCNAATGVGGARAVAYDPVPRGADVALGPPTWLPRDERGASASARPWAERPRF